MASITQKIIHNSLHTVNLYKEGVFWLAYEQSAYYIWQLKGYKPTKKKYKTIAKEVVQIGFPGVSNLLENKIITTQQDNFISFTTTKPIDTVAFTNWKNSINSVPKAIKPTTKTVQEEIIESIRFFNCINKTPLEAMLFINELKTKISHGNV